MGTQMDRIEGYLQSLVGGAIGGVGYLLARPALEQASNIAHGLSHVPVYDYFSDSFFKSSPPERVREAIHRIGNLMTPRVSTWTNRSLIAVSGEYVGDIEKVLKKSSVQPYEILRAMRRRSGTKVRGATYFEESCNAFDDLRHRFRKEVKFKAIFPNLRPSHKFMLIAGGAIMAGGLVFALFGLKKAFELSWPETPVSLNS